MRQKVLNTAQHQTEGPTAVTCKSTCSQGARRAPRQSAVLLSQHLGNDTPWQLSKERVLFQGIRNGIQTAPWVTGLKLTQPKWRGLMPDSCPVAGGMIGVHAGLVWVWEQVD